MSKTVKLCGLTCVIFARIHLFGCVQVEVLSGRLAAATVPLLLLSFGASVELKTPPRQQVDHMADLHHLRYILVC